MNIKNKKKYIFVGLICSTILVPSVYAENYETTTNSIEEIVNSDESIEVEEPIVNEKIDKNPNLRAIAVGGRLNTHKKFTVLNSNGTVADQTKLPEFFGKIGRKTNDSKTYVNNIERNSGTFTSGTLKITNAGTDSNGKWFDAYVVIGANSTTLRLPDVKFDTSITKTAKLNISHKYSDGSLVKEPVLFNFKFSQSTTFGVSESKLYTIIGDTMANNAGRLMTGTPTGIVQVRPGDGDAWNPNGGSITSFALDPQVGDVTSDNLNSNGSLTMYGAWQGTSISPSIPLNGKATGMKIEALDLESKKVLFKGEQKIPKQPEGVQYNAFEFETSKNYDDNIIIDPDEDVKIILKNPKVDEDITNMFEITLIDGVIKMKYKDDGTIPSKLYSNVIEMNISGQLDMDKREQWKSLLNIINGDIFNKKLDLASNFSMNLTSTFNGKTVTTTTQSNDTKISFVVPKIKSLVEIKYEDIDGNEISSPKILDGFVDEDYDLDTDVYKQNIKDYELIIEKLPGNIKGKFIEGGSSVTFVYKKMASKIIVRFVNEKKEEIKDYNVSLDSIIGEVLDLTNNEEIKGNIKKLKDSGYNVTPPEKENAIEVNATEMTITYKVEGLLQLVMAPKTIDFGELTYTANTQRVENPTYESGIKIRDNRLLDGNDWYVTASLEDDMKNGSSVLKDVLRYHNSTEKDDLILGKTSQIIYENNKGNQNIVDITDEWGTEKNTDGIKLQLNSTDVVEPGSYTTSIIWKVLPGQP